MKERVTLTIEKDILERIDERIDSVKIKNRSHAVELLLLKALSSNRPRKAILLAGGTLKTSPDKGGVSQVMLKVNEKTILEWNIELLAKHGVREIMLCIAKCCEDIKNHIGSGEQYGVKITYSEEEFPLGTAGSVKAVSEFVTETTIISNADELKNIDLDDMYEFHKDANKTCTIALTTIDDPSQYGVALMNGSRIVAFVEKPRRESAPSNLISAGLYIIEPEVLKYIPDGFSTIEQDVFPKLAKQDKLFGYLFSGQWFTTRNDEKYMFAKHEWKGL